MSMCKLCLFVIFFLSFFSCTPKKTKQDIEAEFNQNHKNFVLDKKVVYKSIAFKLPSCFEPIYWNEFTVLKSSACKSVNVFNTHFSVEEYKSAKTILHTFPAIEVNSDMLNALHDAYVNRRLQSVSSGTLSIKKILPKKIADYGVIQTVGTESEYGNPLLYITATLKFDLKYYVFQWIAPNEMMKYTYDDFERILKTVHLSK